MSTHIDAAAGEVAPRVLLPGDPLRARWIAENFLEDATCYSSVRGMLGFTGRYAGERFSVQGTGMGQPSAAIYVSELIRDYDAQQLVRVGSCGAISDSLRVRDIVLAISASTDSAMNRIRFEGLDYAATADYTLLRAASDAADAASLPAVVAPLFSADAFYSDRPELLMRMAEYGVVAVEMECSALYTLAAKYGRQALTICTVSDHVLTGEQTSAQERQETFEDMVGLALQALLSTSVSS